MTLLELLAKAAGSATLLTDLLATVKNRFPELAGEVDKVVAGLNAAIDPANLSALSVTILEELKNIGQGKIDPRDHPSDVA